MIYLLYKMLSTTGKLKVSRKRYSKTIKNKKLIIVKICDRFGITDKTISSLKKADGLVVGSQLCKIITNSLKKRQNPVTNLNKIVYNLKKQIT